jgi:hypothetical protein
MASIACIVLGRRNAGRGRAIAFADIAVYTLASALIPIAIPGVLDGPLVSRSRR